MKKPRSILDIADALKPAFASVGMKGRLDIRWKESRSVSWVGKPGGIDMLITITIEPHPDARA